MPLKDDRRPSRPDREAPAPPSRQPYKTPTLVEYGPVAKLTQMMAVGSIADAGGGMMTCL